VIWISSGGEQGTSSIAATITGTGGTVALTRHALVDSSSSAAASGAFEVSAAFDIEPADLPGSGPYTVTGTCDDADTTTRMGLSGIIISDAPGAPVVTTRDADAAATITPTADDSLVVALVATSAQSSALDFTDGVVAVPTSSRNEVSFDFGDGHLIGTAIQGPAPLSVASNAAGRKMIALLAYSPQE